ncbi:energy transducer TonB [Usitatibacter palustris]|uniref:Protein TonB n=1 Tax=Usitatibacter palustris TaxID=2732487 RepID=A0A6M4H7L7_9PROT|nr:energy transducer TonB [Usitatibacter palustris]QJR15155.1 hypothetical protein DSM104440_01972 [Usitatibacter palustris]
MSAVAAETYDPTSNTSRATVFLVIVAIHVAALAIIATARHVAIAMQRDPIIVKMIPEPPRPKTPPPPTVPLPPLVKPEVHLLAPPPVENVFMVRMEEKKPAAPQPVAAIVSANPSPAPPVEAPRFDMAYLNNPAPSYPPASRRTREEGRVMLRVLVNAGGTVEAIEVQKTSGFSRLDEAAVAAVRRWRFHPARSGDLPVEGYAIVPVSFRLS